MTIGLDEGVGVGVWQSVSTHTHRHAHRHAHRHKHDVRVIMARAICLRFHRWRWVGSGGSEGGGVAGAYEFIMTAARGTRTRQYVVRWNEPHKIWIHRSVGIVVLRTKKITRFVCIYIYTRDFILPGKLLKIKIKYPFVSCQSHFFVRPPQPLPREQRKLRIYNNNN